MPLSNSLSKIATLVRSIHPRKWLSGLAVTLIVVGPVMHPAFADQRYSGASDATASSDSVVLPAPSASSDASHASDTSGTPDTHFTEQLDSHTALVQQLIDKQHAQPLVADCAAHAAFVVPTSPVYDHVEFLPTSLDAQHASAEPWNQPFDDGKQHITVDTLVLVNGLGYRKNAGEDSQPDLLKFRCGYIADKLLAFAYNEPDLHMIPHNEGGTPRRGRHGVARGRHAPRGAKPVHHGGHAISQGSAHKQPATHRGTGHSAQ